MNDTDLEALSREELVLELRKLLAARKELEASLGEHDPLRVLHELGVHQVELEMQNRDLLEKQIALEEARSRYADLYDFAPVGYCTHDGEGRIREINLTGASLLGEFRERLLGKHLASLAAIANKEALSHHLRSCNEGGDAAGQKRVTTELTLRTRARGDAVVQMVSVPNRSAGAAEIEYRTVLTDITALKQMEERLRFLAEAGERLVSSLDYRSTAAAVAHLPVPFVADLSVLDVLDDDRRIRRLDVVFADPARQMALGDRFRRSAPQPDEPSWQSEVIAAGEPLLFTTLPAPRPKQPDAEDDLDVLRAARVKSMIVVPLAARGRAFGTLLLGVLHGERRYSEDDLPLVRSIGQRAAMALDNARLHDQAQRAIRTREALLASVSHDLRTPLSVILMSAEMLREAAPKSPEARIQKAAAVIQRVGEQMSHLIKDLLDVASLEAGHLAMEWKSCAAAELLKDATDALGDLIAQKSLHLSCELPAEGPLIVLCDQERVLQVLGNLIGNAIKFSQPGESIIVRVEAQGGEACFSVADRGPGIAPGHLPHIFDRFWQAQETARLGTGLGLSIVKGIVEAHGGKVWVKSWLGVGSTFFFTLPLAPEMSAAARLSEPPVKSGKGEQPAASTPARPVVLVVDDDADMRAS